MESIEMRALAEMYLGKSLTESCELVYEDFKQEQGIPTGSQYDDQNLPGKVAMALRDLELDEMLATFKDANVQLKEDSLQDTVKDYVQSTNDHDYLINQFEYRYNFEDALATSASQLLDILRNTPETGDVNDSYWMNSIQHVNSLKERIVLSDNIELFLEEYAPEWEEVKEQ